MEEKQIQELLQAVGNYIAWTQGEGEKEDGEGRFARMVAAYVCLPDYRKARQSYDAQDG